MNKPHQKNRNYPINEPVIDPIPTYAQLKAAYPDLQYLNSPPPISKKAVFLILRSATLDNIHKGIKYGLWTSTPKSNARIDQLVRENKEVFVLYSVVGTKAFQACARIVSPFDPTDSFLYWDEPLKWFGTFKIQCLFFNELKQKVLDEKQPADLGSIVLTDQTDCTEVDNNLGQFVFQCFKDMLSDDETLNPILRQFPNLDKRENQIRVQRDADQNFKAQQAAEQQLFERSPFEYRNYHKRQNQQKNMQKQADYMMYQRAYFNNFHQPYQQWGQQYYNQAGRYGKLHNSSRQQNNYYYDQQFQYYNGQGQQYQQYPYSKGQRGYGYNNNKKGYNNNNYNNSYHNYNNSNSNHHNQYYQNQYNNHNNQQNYQQMYYPQQSQQQFSMNQYQYTEQPQNSQKNHNQPA